MRKDEELESLAKLTELSKYIEYCVVKKFRASSSDAITVSKIMDSRIICNLHIFSVETWWWTVYATPSISFLTWRTCTWGS